MVYGMQAMKVGSKMRYYIYCLLLLFLGCVGDEKRIKKDPMTRAGCKTSLG